VFHLLFALVHRGSAEETDSVEEVRCVAAGSMGKWRGSCNVQVAVLVLVDGDDGGCSGGVSDDDVLTHRLENTS
jgi:hypothetical protein